MKLTFLILAASLTLAATSALARSPMPPVILAAFVEDEDGIEVWLNPKTYWKKDQGLIESYTENQAKLVAKITDKANLCNAAESIYEPCKPGRTLAKVKADTLKAGAQFDESFQAWAEKVSKE